MAKIEVTPVSSGYNIAALNATLQAIETEFKDKVVYRNEEGSMQRSLDMNGNRVINLPAPVNTGDAVNYGFLVNSDVFVLSGLVYRGFWAASVSYLKNNYVTEDGNVYICQTEHVSASDFDTDLSEGRWVVFSAGGGDLLSTNNLSDLSDVEDARTNLDVPSTTGEGASGNWSINAATSDTAGTAVTAINAGNATLLDGVSISEIVQKTSDIGSAILPAGTTAQRDVSPSPGYSRYNSTTGGFEIYSGSTWLSFATPVDATTSVKGIVELATTTEASTGTDSTRAVTSAGVEAHMNANALGWGQTWQNVLASRAVGTSYQNTSGRPIAVCIYGYKSSPPRVCEVSPDGSAWITAGAVVQSTDGASISFVVPNGWYYRASSGISLYAWAELR